MNCRSTIKSTPYAVLPMFATRFAPCTVGIWVTFIEPYIISTDIKLFVWDSSPVHLVRWNLLLCFPCICNLEFSDISFGDLLRFEHRTALFSYLCIPVLTPNSSGNMQGIWGVFMQCPPWKIYLGFGEFNTLRSVQDGWCYFLERRLLNLNQKFRWCMHVSLIFIQHWFR